MRGYRDIRRRGRGLTQGGKSWALLLDPLRHFNNRRYTHVIFRRTTPMITNPGALWDEAGKLYLQLGARPRASHPMSYIMPTGMRVMFAHLEREDTVYDWQGAQVGGIGFDELTHFTQNQFFYMLSRARSDAGVLPRIRATTNPDADSWVAKLIAWWVDQETGLPIPERAGKIRWFIRRDNEIIWADSRSELVRLYGKDCEPMSLTFIPSKLDDNPALLRNNPKYRANLLALPKVERERLLGGNWKIRATAGTVFRREWFKIVDVPPAGGKVIRYWDRAATEKTDANDPAATAGIKLKRLDDGTLVIMHMARGFWSPGGVESSIKNMAAQDGKSVIVGIEQDPGQAGVVEAKQYTKLLQGYTVKLYPARKDKIARALPVSAQAEAGNILVVRGPWNDTFFDEAENFPDGKKKDQVDALSGAFAVLVDGLTGDFTKEMSDTQVKPVMPSLNKESEW